MAGNGPPPKDPSQRRNRSAKTRGEWSVAEGIGWQHGPVPDPPKGLLKASVDAWHLWLNSWIAAHWLEEDMPIIRQMILLFDAVERGDLVRMPELRLQHDYLGLTHKGRQDRRWQKPDAVDEGSSSTSSATRTGGVTGQTSQQRNLKVVS